MESSMTNNQTRREIAFSPFMKSLNRKKCFCNIHNSMDINNMIKTPSFENMINNSSFSNKQNEKLESTINKLFLNNETVEDKEEKEMKISINQDNLDLSNEYEHYFFENFQKTLKMWKDIELKYLKCLEMQEIMEKTFKNSRESDETLKVDTDVILPQKTWKLIYEDISSDQNKEHFMSVLNDWIKRDTLMKSQPCTSTPIRPIKQEFNLDISDIYYYSSWERDLCILDISHSSVQNGDPEEKEQNLVNNIKEDFSSSDSGTNCDYDSNDHDCCDMSLNCSDMMLDCGYKSDDNILDSGSETVSKEDKSIKKIENKIFTEKHENILSFPNKEVSTTDDSSLVKSLILSKFDKRIRYQKNKKRYATPHNRLNGHSSTDSSGSISSSETDIKEYDDDKRFAPMRLEIKENNKALENINNNRKSQQSVATYDVSDLISNDYYTYDEDIHIETDPDPPKKSFEKYQQHNKQTTNISYEEARECLNYIEEIKAQLDVIQQIKKALLVCNLNKKLQGTREHIEAEKILLLATYKYNILVSAMKSANIIDTPSPHAVMHIRNLKFSIRQDYVGDFIYYYICVFKEGINVKFSDIVTPLDNTVKFNNDLTFEKLTPSSKVQIDLYSLKIRNEPLQIDNRCGNKLNKTLHKIFSRKCKANREETSVTQNCSFELVGSAVLSRTSFSEFDKYTLSNNSESSEIRDEFTASVEVSLNLKYEVAGLLTIRKDEIKSSWTTRWCRLKEYEILFWNHPHEENTREPRGHFNLKYSTGKDISSNLTLCTRPRTLVLEMQNPREQVNSLYFLSADNNDEFHEWQYKLNSVVATLKCWKQIFDKNQLELES